jgi:hypothetical protein
MLLIVTPQRNEVRAPVIWVAQHFQRAKPARGDAGASSSRLSLTACKQVVAAASRVYGCRRALPNAKECINGKGFDRSL